jgi:glycosyltransferase involved in cell wall biosynthesis
MKILFVGNGMLDTDNYPVPNQGGSVQTWGLSRELAKRGHELFIVRRSITKGEEIFENVNLIGVNFNGMENVIHPRFMSLPFYATRICSSLYFSMKSLKLVQNINPDILCLIDRFSGVFPAYLKTQKLYIMHVPDGLDFFRPYSIYASKLNSIMFYVKKGLETSILQRVDRIVVLNSYVEKYLRTKGLGNVIRIPNGISPEEFVNKGDENYVLYAGRFDWNKNICELVNAFAEVHKSYPKCNLYLVGAGPEEGKIRSLVKEKSLQTNVKIISWIPRKELIEEVISKCSAFVLPSFFEVDPVVVLEAMASGKPVIARTNMGTVDIIGHGENGYLYNNEEELRSYLEPLLSDGNLRKKIGRNARRTVEEKYSFTQIADKYEELFIHF